MFALLFVLSGPVWYPQPLSASKELKTPLSLFRCVSVRDEMLYSSGCLSLLLEVATFFSSECPNLLIGSERGICFSSVCPIVSMRAWWALFFFWISNLFVLSWTGFLWPSNHCNFNWYMFCLSISMHGHIFFPFFTLVTIMFPCFTTIHVIIIYPDIITARFFSPFCL